MSKESFRLLEAMSALPDHLVDQFAPEEADRPEQKSGIRSGGRAPGGPPPGPAPPLGPVGRGSRGVPVSGGGPLAVFSARDGQQRRRRRRGRGRGSGVPVLRRARAAPGPQ